MGPRRSQFGPVDAEIVLTGDGAMWFSWNRQLNQLQNYPPLRTKALARTTPFTSAIR